MNDHFTTMPLLIQHNKPGDVVITINNSVIVIIFNTSSKWLWKKSQCGTALTPFIEIVDKELLKYEVESIRWRYMIDEHVKQ